MVVAALPPGPRGLPLLGNMLEFRRDTLGYLQRLERSYGRMATVHLGRVPVVLLFRPEHVHHVLLENSRNFTNREVAGGLIFGGLLVLSMLSQSFSEQAASSLEEILGNGLLTSDGDFHRWQRRIVQPAFARTRVDNYADTIVSYTAELLDGWQPGATIDLSRELGTLILRIIVKILVDVDVSDRSSELESIIESLLLHPVGLVEGLLRIRADLTFLPYGKRMAAKRQADVLLYDLIHARLADRRDVGDVLSMLLHAQDEGESAAMSDEQLRDEIVSLIAAGHETTTNTLAWTFHLLSLHPEVVTTLQAELHSVLGDRQPSVADLPALSYLDCVIKESMRLYPAGWTQGRKAIGPFELDGYHFPAGTLVMFSQWILHRLPDVWDQPEAFRPERWQAEAAVEVPRLAYFPFGAGERMCMGASLADLEARLVVATILRRFSPRPAGGAPPIPQPLITLRPKNGVRIILDAADS